MGSVIGATCKHCGYSKDPLRMGGGLGGGYDYLISADTADRTVASVYVKFGENPDPRYQPYHQAWVYESSEREERPYVAEVDPFAGTPRKNAFRTIYQDTRGWSRKILYSLLHPRGFFLTRVRNQHKCPQCGKWTLRFYSKGMQVD